MADLYDIASSGMAAQRTQMDVIAENLANAGIPRADGTVFRAKTATFAQASAFTSSLNDALSDRSGLDFTDLSEAGMDVPESPSGVEVASIVDRDASPQYKFDPGNPFAARSGTHKGYVALPDVDPIEQMVALVSAGRAYDANVSMLEAAKQMDLEAADIDRMS
jgi:flagellar basal-body rod protein FlgC